MVHINHGHRQFQGLPLFGHRRKHHKRQHDTQCEQYQVTGLVDQPS